LLGCFKLVEQAAQFLGQLFVGLEGRQRFQHAQVAFGGKLSPDVRRHLGCCLVDACAGHD